jgi:hypothetical protein
MRAAETLRIIYLPTYLPIHLHSIACSLQVLTVRSGTVPVKGKDTATNHDLVGIAKSLSRFRKGELFILLAV